jgi:hypothetical protein
MPHTELLNDIESVQLLYRVTVWCFSTVGKNPFVGKWQSHYVSNNAYINLLLRCDKNTFCGTTFHAVSLTAPNTCPQHCARIILIRSAERRVWYFISIMLFHVQKLFSRFFKYIWYLVAHICVNSCCHSWNKKIFFWISGRTDVNSESSKNGCQ